MLLKEASTQPVFVRKDTWDSFVWRIRNMPWTADVYQLSVEGKDIVLRTTNKKYFKRWTINDLNELGLPLEPSRLSCNYASNTLVVSYKKPIPVIQLQEKAKAERAHMKQSSEEECKTS